MRIILSGLLCMSLWLCSSAVRALELQVEAHAGGAAFAGRGWDATRPAETLGGSLSLRLHALVSLDLRFLTQRLRFVAVDDVQSSGRGYAVLLGAHVYPLARRYRIDPRIGLFAGELATHARSRMDVGSVKLDMRAVAAGPSVGVLTTLTEHLALGLDLQVLRAFQQRACMEASGHTSCGALDSTRTHLWSGMFSFAARFR